MECNARKKVKQTLIHHKSSFMMSAIRRVTSYILILCVLVGGAFQPKLLASKKVPVPILGVPEIIAIIVELAAGQALDIWLNSNRDPREDKTSAVAVGAYYTAARYRMVETVSPRSACPGGSSTTVQKIAKAQQGNERHTDPTGGPIDELKKRAKLSGWLKTIEVIDDQGNCAEPRSWTVCGSSSNPYSADQTLANLQAIYDDPSLRLGNVLVDKTEQWNVGKFVVYSDWSYSTAILHPKLRKEGHYLAEMYFEKQAVDYVGGKMTGVGQKTYKEKLTFPLRADRPDKIYLNLVGTNERLLSAPEAFGGVERWVEELKDVHECVFPNQTILHLFPADIRCYVDKLVVKQQNALLPQK